MSKTKKNKYLRKNRHGKNGKHKHKTRKVQRGGEPGNTAVDAGVNALPIGNGAAIIQKQPTLSSLTGKENKDQHVKPLSNVEFRAKQKAEAKAEAEATAATAATAAAAAKAEAAKEDKEKKEEKEETGKWLRPGGIRPGGNDMRHGFGGPMHATSSAVTTASHTGNNSTTIEIKPTNKSQSETNEERDARLGKDALKRSQDAQNPKSQAAALANAPSNIFESFLLNFFESKKKELPTALAIDDLTTKMSTIIKENNKNFEIVNKVGDAIRKHIQDILDSDKNLSDDDRNKLLVLIANLAEVVSKAQEIANSSTELAIAGTSDGNLDALKHQRYGQGFGGQKFGQKFDGPRNAGVAKTPTNKVPTPSSGKKQDSPSESAKPKSVLKKFTDFFTKKKEQNPAAPTEPPAAAATAEAEATPAAEPPAPISQGGGNKTRKNGQYIHEIKKNRNELFNKEMEIINSIRNFKYGHNYDIKKKFMKTIKRS